MVSGWITLAVGIRSGAEITRGFEKSRKYCNFYNGVKMISGWCTQAFGIRLERKSLEAVTSLLFTSVNLMSIL